MTRSRFAGVLAVLALTFLTAAPVHAAGVPVVSDISEITIHTTSGTWAFTNAHDETIRHVDGAFVRSDAAVLRDADVQRLLDALVRPNATTISPGRTGFDRAYLLANLDEAEAFLGDAVSLPAARATFDANVSRQRRDAAVVRAKLVPGARLRGSTVTSRSRS